MTDTTFSTCECGCNEAVSAKALYRPGHDARHVSILLAPVKEAAKFDRVAADAIATGLKVLPSESLRAKFRAACDRAVSKVTGSTGAVEYAEPVEDEVAAPSPAKSVIREDELPDIKVGRWFYPVRRFTYDDGTQQVLRNLNTNKKEFLSDEWEEVVDY